MARTKWTDEELEILARTAGNGGLENYHLFGRATNYSKSYDAWEVKRRRFLGGEAQKTAVEYAGGGAMPPAIGVTRDEVADYAGFRMAFFDIETTFSMQPIVLYAAIADEFGNIEQFRKGPDWTDDRELVAAIAAALSKYDIWLTWNGKLFDVPVVNGRLRYHGLPPLPGTKHIDLMYYATGGSMRIGRRSLASVSEYFDVPNRKTPLSVRTWDLALAGDAEAYEKIIEHCDADVLVTRDVFRVLKTQIANIHR